MAGSNFGTQHTVFFCFALLTTKFRAMVYFMKSFVVTLTLNNDNGLEPQFHGKKSSP